MAQPFSARFMSGRGGNRRETYTVPEGRRAVIRHFSAYKWATTGSPSLFLYVHGIPVFHVPPGTQQAFFFEVRFTAYERETIQMVVNGLDWSYTLDGFLFADPDGEPDDADNEITPVTLARPVETTGGAPDAA